MQRYRVLSRCTAQVQITAVALVVLLMSVDAIGQSAPSPVTAPGRLQGTTGTMSIGTAASGVVKEIFVHEGNRVQAGQLIVILSCGPIEAEVRAREAQLRAAQAVLDRVIRGPRSEEITVAEAAVGYSTARAKRRRKPTNEPKLCVKALPSLRHVFWRRCETPGSQQLSSRRLARSLRYFERDPAKKTLEMLKAEGTPPQDSWKRHAHVWINVRFVPQSTGLSSMSFPPLANS
jgi:multidrug efflux pump subunit AcrA (membrane-fusion protein)